MKKRQHNFTLVEMLTVVAIIGILAAIVTPVVIIARNRGRETSAKSDITSIMAALKQMDADYGKVLRRNGSNYYTGRDQQVSVSSDIATVTGDAYDAMIAELTAPKNDSFTASDPVSVNKRKKIYLEPRKEFDPSAVYTGQTETLYRDPWGNAYRVYIKVTMDDELAVPGTSRRIPGNFAVYSFGPDGVDNHGCHVDLEDCIHSSDSSNHKNHDDIASWLL